ncbi:unnamed protein product [Coregonus sp. 'balchen']|nr:unnamed protein product [Coregonus sp. 'balchen']
MSGQEVPTNPAQEQVDTGDGVSDGPTTTPTTTATLTVPVMIKKEPCTQGASNGKDVPAEICVVLGGGGGRSRNDQTQGSYVCGICGKKYKYYNCFQTHVRAHRGKEGLP